MAVDLAAPADLAAVPDLAARVDLAGCAAQMMSDIGTIFYGQQKVGSTSNPVTVTITNVGMCALTINAIVLMGAAPADFVAKPPPLPLVLPPGLQAKIDVAFAPTALGARQATISMQSAWQTLNVGLVGTGT